MFGVSSRRGRGDGAEHQYVMFLSSENVDLFPADATGWARVVGAEEDILRPVRSFGKRLTRFVGSVVRPENGIAHDKFVYLPVAPAHAPNINRSDFLRKKLRISPDKTIVLHSGAFSDHTCAIELLEGATRWPKDFALVVHTSHRPKKSDPHIAAACNITCPNLHLSMDPLSPRAYERMVASADMGLVLYKCVPGKPGSFAFQKNLANIGLSSGKFALYMKCALPTVTSSQSTYRELLREYDFGISLADVRELDAVLRDLRDKYAHHSAEARRLFEEKLAFDTYWDTVSRRICVAMK